MAKHNSCTHSLIGSITSKMSGRKQRGFCEYMIQIGKRCESIHSVEFSPVHLPCRPSRFLTTENRHTDRIGNTGVFVRWILKRDEASAGNYKPRIPFISFHIWSIRSCSRHASIICWQACVCAGVCMCECVLDLPTVHRSSNTQHTTMDTTMANSLPPSCTLVIMWRKFPTCT